MAGDAAVGEEIGRVGEDAVETAFGIFGMDGVEEFEGVAVVEADERSVRGVYEFGSCEFGSRGRRWRQAGSLSYDGAVLAEFEMGRGEGFGVG